MSSNPKGVGIHVFAGGFTRGMRKVLPVVGQLEIHNFGRHSVEALGLPFMNADKWEDWDNYKSTWNGCSFCYGNPRCTAFSSYSAGGTDEVRGPRAKPVQDIWDLCRFGVKQGLDLIAFESVQQAYSVGKVTLNCLKEDLFEPNNYRIAHLFVNTSAEGNAQCRRRYFCIAYRNNRNFNVYLPKLSKYRPTVSESLKNHPLLKDQVPHEQKIDGKKNFDTWNKGSYKPLSKDEKAIVPHMIQGDSIQSMCKRIGDDKLKQLSEKYWNTWVHRNSEVPFSLHSIRRIRADYTCPVICSTSANFIHPTENRPLTVGELSVLMGWDDVPVGCDPVSQLGKGVVPSTGKWLGEQIKAYFNNDWGNDDFESEWDNQQKMFVGHDYTGCNNKPLEKVFNLTWYIAPLKEKKK